MPDDFDPATCIHAADLRAAGIILPAEIPDVAWISRAAIHHAESVPPESSYDPETKRITVRFYQPIAYSAPFRWIAMVVDEGPEETRIETTHHEAWVNRPGS